MNNTNNAELERNLITARLRLEALESRPVLAKEEYDRRLQELEKLNADQQQIEQFKDEYITKSEYNSIECSAKITKSGNLQFVIKYNEDDIYCKNQCKFTIIPSTLFFSNTKTIYTNKNKYLSETESNDVDVGTTPIFEVEFYDPYNNQLEASTVNNIKINTSLVGTEVKLCVSDEGKTKFIKVCPTSNGDDNENKWKYLTNGDSYKLRIYDATNSNNEITYPIKLIGGAADGSSDEPDWSKTTIGNETLTIVAGANINHLSIDCNKSSKDSLPKVHLKHKIKNDEINIEIIKDKDNNFISNTKGIRNNIKKEIYHNTELESKKSRPKKKYLTTNKLTRVIDDGGVFSIHNKKFQIVNNDILPNIKVNIYLSHKIGIIVEHNQKRYKVICLDNVPSSYSTLNLNKLCKEYELEVKEFATNLCSANSKESDPLLVTS